MNKKYIFAFLAVGLSVLFVFFAWTQGEESVRGVPKYPEATVEPSISESVGIIAENLKVEGYSSSKGLKVIKSWYEQKLQGSGWAATENFSKDNRDAVLFRKEDQGALLHLHSTSDATEIVVICGEIGVLKSKYEGILTSLGLDVFPPRTPSGVSAHSEISGKIVLDWEEGGGGTLDHYNVYRSQDENFRCGNETFLVKSNSTNYQDLEIAENTTCYYKVTSVDVEGNESEPSARASAVPELNPKSRTFNFSLSLYDNSSGVLNLENLNHKPAGSRGRVKIGRKGHFRVENRRIRFLGINITAGDCFPTHEQAEKIAERLSNFGINLVRFHHMDANWTDTIFDEAYSDTRHLETSKLDRFDYFFKELKEEGIYVNVNLLCSRDFKSEDGLPAAIDRMDWKNEQTVGMFNEKMIKLQKEYAKKLLARKNPYTGTYYANDPALAFVEINNERGLLQAWLTGDIKKLPKVFSEELRGEWNSFLEKKYGSNFELRKSWVRTQPVGEEMVLNGSFSQGLSFWSFEEHENASGIISVDEAASGEGNSVRIEVTSTGRRGWHIQLNQGMLGVENGGIYTLEFQAKAENRTEVGVNLSMSHYPWDILGFDKDIELTTSWKKFKFVFESTTADPNARINFTDMGDENTTYWFSEVSLKPGGSIGLMPGENLNVGNIRIFRDPNLAQRTESGVGDWINFLWEKEKSHWLEMKSYLEENLGIGSLITGTQIHCSPPNIVKEMDYTDSHNYWWHPVLPSGWGGKWWIRNSTMVEAEDAGAIGQLGLEMIYGKPFTVSEYNHSAPNTFGSEAFLFLSSYGSFQGWDGILGFNYGGVDPSESKIRAYFDIADDPGKMMGYIPAAYLFRRGDVEEAENLVAVSIDREREIDVLKSTEGWRMVNAGHEGVTEEMTLLHRTAIVPGGVDSPEKYLRPEEVSVPSGEKLVSDTGQISWNMDDGILRVNTEDSKVLLGNVIGRRFTFGGVVMKPKSAIQDWAAITMTLLRGKNIENRAKKILITANGAVANREMNWRSFPEYEPLDFPPPKGENITLANWGKSPTLAEGIVCEFSVPYPAENVEVYALDGNGRRMESIPVFGVGENSIFEASSEYETTWYEVEISGDEDVASPG